MGIMPSPTEYGNDCALCYAPDKTPKFLKLFFGGMKYGELWNPLLGPAPNGYHDLKQTEVAPCRWTSLPVNDWKITYATLPEQSGVEAFLHLTPFGFLSYIEESCKRYFVNILDGPANSFYWGGWAFICTPDEMEAWLNLVTPTTGPDPRMDIFPGDNGIIDLRFANKQDGTHVYIQLDTNAL